MLPAFLAILLAIGGIFGKVGLVEVILLTRSVGDPIFNMSKSEFVRAEMGLGAALNLIVIATTLTFLVTRPRVSITAALWCWLPFLAATLIAVPIAPDTTAAFRFFLVLLSHAAFFQLAFYLVDSHDRLRRYLFIILASSILPAVSAFAELALGLAETEDGTRPAGTFSHPNIFAYYILIIIALTFYALNATSFNISAKMRKCLTVYVPILVLLLLMTKTRSAWLGGALLLTVQAVRFDRRYLIYFALAPLVVLFVPEVAERLSDLSTGNYNESYAKLNSYAWRELLWQSGLEWAKERPFFGYGLESFAHFVAEFFPVNLGDSATTDAHSVYVQLIFETGAVGLAAFAWAFIFVIANLLRLARTAPEAWMLLAMVGAYLAMAYADNMLYYLTPNWYFWFILGGGCAVLRAQAAADQTAVQPVVSTSVPTEFGRGRQPAEPRGL